PRPPRYGPRWAVAATGAPVPAPVPALAAAAPLDRADRLNGRGGRDGPSRHLVRRWVRRGWLRHIGRRNRRRRLPLPLWLAVLIAHGTRSLLGHRVKTPGHSP